MKYLILSIDALSLSIHLLICSTKYSINSIDVLLIDFMFNSFCLCEIEQKKGVKSPCVLL